MLGDLPLDPSDKVVMGRQMVHRQIFEKSAVPVMPVVLENCKAQIEQEAGERGLTVVKHDWVVAYWPYWFSNDHANDRAEPHEQVEQALEASAMGVPAEAIVVRVARVYRGA